MEDKYARDIENYERERKSRQQRINSDFNQSIIHNVDSDAKSNDTDQNDQSPVQQHDIGTRHNKNNKSSPTSAKTHSESPVDNCIHKKVEPNDSIRSTCKYSEQSCKKEALDPKLCTANIMPNCQKCQKQTINGHRTSCIDLPSIPCHCNYHGYAGCNKSSCKDNHCMSCKRTCISNCKNSNSSEGNSCSLCCNKTDTCKERTMIHRVRGKEPIERTPQDRCNNRQMQIKYNDNGSGQNPECNSPISKCKDGSPASKTDDSAKVQHNNQLKMQINGYIKDAENPKNLSPSDQQKFSDTKPKTPSREEIFVLLPREDLGPKLHCSRNHNPYDFRIPQVLQSLSDIKCDIKEKKSSDKVEATIDQDVKSSYVAKEPKHNANIFKTKTLCAPKINAKNHSQPPKKYAIEAAKPLQQKSKLDEKIRTLEPKGKAHISSHYPQPVLQSVPQPTSHDMPQPVQSRAMVKGRWFEDKLESINRKTSKISDECKSNKDTKAQVTNYMMYKVIQDGSNCCEILEKLDILKVSVHKQNHNTGQ